jgi:GDP-L-fucose synthase
MGFGGQLKVQSFRKEINEMINLKNSKVLVTGAAGFIGTNLIKRLVGEGAEVTGTLFKRRPQETIDGVKYINVDLTKDEDCISACRGQEYIFMCAANSSGAEVMERAPLTHLTPNVVMNAQMLASAYAEKIKKFVFISSNTVYPLTDFPVKEDDTSYKFFKTYHIVAWMKMFSEEMCKMYSNHINTPMQTLVVRPANLYGPYDKYNKSESKVIAALLRRFVEGDNPLEVWGDGNDVKDFLYIDDFIEALIKVFKLDDNIGPVNIASGKSMTIKNVIDCLKIISGKEKTIVNFDESKPSMIPVRLISNDYLRSLIQWEPRFDLGSGLKSTYEWYLNFYSNKDPDSKL